MASLSSLGDLSSFESERLLSQSRVRIAYLGMFKGSQVSAAAKTCKCHECTAVSHTQERAIVSLEPPAPAPEQPLLRRSGANACDACRARSASRAERYPWLTVSAHVQYAEGDGCQ
jgi:hypothetical protein